MSDDPLREVRGTWERNHSKRLRALADEFPVSSREEWNPRRRCMVDYGCPKVRLLCPKGHRVVTVEAGSSRGHSAVLYPSRTISGDGRSEGGKPVTFDAFWKPEGTHKAQSVCAVPGCPTITAGLHCIKHAKSPDELTHVEGMYTLRVTLACPNAKCSYRGTKQMETLYKLYYVAVQHAWSEIRLPD